MRNAVEGSDGRDHVGDTSEDKRILLKYISKKYRLRLCSQFIWLRIGSSCRLF
jgi:hypothetical protein